MKKKFLSSAPWRGVEEEEETEEKFKDGKLKVTNQPGGESTMYVPAKKSKSTKDNNDKDSLTEIDPELKYTFQKNCQASHSVLQIQSKSNIDWLHSVHTVVVWQASDSVTFKFLQRVFSVDTLVKPLPPALSNNVSRNLSFFTRIFTQFFDPEGISNAQKSLGLGQEEKVRRVR